MNVRWWLLALIGSLALAQALFWDGSLRQLDLAKVPEPYSPAVARYDAARASALSLAFGLQGAHLIERFATEAVAAQASGTPIHFGPDEAMDEGFRLEVIPAVTERARQQLARWSLAEPRVALGVYGPERTEGWPPHLESMTRPPTRLNRIAAAGRLADGSAYCIRVAGGARLNARLLSYLEGADGSPTGPGTFGECWPYVRYGIPGAHVAGWMARTGAAVAGSPTSDFLQDLRRDGGAALLVAVGARQTLQLADAAGADRCIQGEREACRALFLAPRELGFGTQERAIRETVPLAMARVTSGSFLPASFLYDLEAEFGPERMQAFWSSDADVVSAFEAAFGVDLETTMMELGRERFGYARTGPSVGGWGWIGLLAALTLGLASGIRAMDRRAVA